MYRSMTIAISMVSLLAACTSAGVSNKVNAVGASLMLAEQTWVRTCHDVPTLPVCVDPLKTRIKEYDQKAYEAVEMAKKNEALLSLAISAVGDFTSATTR